MDDPLVRFVAMPAPESADNSPAADSQGRGPLMATARQGGLALCDQAIVSATSFATSVLVGRIAGPTDLALYSLAMTLLVIASTVQDSLILLPYTIHATRLDARERAIRAGSSLILHLVAALSASSVLIGSAIVLRAGGLPGPYAGLLTLLAVVAPAWLLRDLGRRMLVAQLQLRSALNLDAGVAAVQLGTVAGIAFSGALSATTALALIGLACAVTTLAWLVRRRDGFRVQSGQTAAVWRWNWRFGRWVLAGRIAAHLNSAALLLWWLALVQGPVEAGIFAAGLTIPLASNPLILGAGLFLTPKVADTYRRGGAPAVRRFVATMTRVLGGALAGFVLTVLIVGGFLLEMLYGSAYANQTPLVVILALAISVSALSMAASSALLVFERPHANLLASLLGLAVLVPTAGILLPEWGALGAACSLLGAGLCEAGTRFVLFERASRRVPAAAATMIVPSVADAPESSP